MIICKSRIIVKINGEKMMKKSTKNEIVKIFWIFIIGSALGCLVETIVCLVQKGHFEIRQGVIYGPFIPVYGAGAVIYYLIVPRITGAKIKNVQEISWIKIFLYTMILGGLTEYLFSYAQECMFGTVSWEYSNLSFNLNGRTSLLHCMYWGIGGILFIKLLYPSIRDIDVFNNITKNAKIATIAFFVFMILNTGISMLAGYRQYERVQNISADTRLDRFLDKHYPDSVMDKIFSNKQYTNQNKGNR